MRYRFGDFVLSPARRVLADGGRVVPLIPRYFDLLVLLVEQRDRAVTKQEIFASVWADVVVSESALTQAVRTIRRTLGDDSREPRFLRTVSRRGYQFVYTPIRGTGPAPGVSHRASRMTARASSWPGRCPSRRKASAVPSSWSAIAAS